VLGAWCDGRVGQIERCRSLYSCTAVQLYSCTVRLGNFLVHTAVPYSRRHFCKRDCLRTPREGDFYLLLAPGLTTCITASGQMTADRVSRETQQETGALVPLDQQRTLFRSAERTPREGRGTCKSMHAPLLLYAPHSCVTSTTSPATPLGVSSSSVYISTKTRPAWVASAPHKPRSSRAFDSYDPAEPSSPADPENDPITPCNAA
jgi:hypothetical protein